MILKLLPSVLKSRNNCAYSLCQRMVNLTYIGSLIRIVCTAIKVAVFVVLNIMIFFSFCSSSSRRGAICKGGAFVGCCCPGKSSSSSHSLTSFLHLLCSEAVFKSMPNKLPINIFAKQQPHHKHLEFLRKNVRLPAATAAWSANTHSSGRNK